MGEPVIAERMIRIADNPVLQSIDDHGNHLGEKEEESEEEKDEEKDRELLSEVSERGGGRREILHESSLPPLQVGSHPFSAMTADHDKERQDQITRSRPLTEEEAQIRQYVVYHIRSRDMLPVSPILLLLLLLPPSLPPPPPTPFPPPPSPPPPPPPTPPTPPPSTGIKLTFGVPGQRILRTLLVLVHYTKLVETTWGARWSSMWGDYCLHPKLTSLRYMGECDGGRVMVRGCDGGKV